MNSDDYEDTVVWKTITHVPGILDNYEVSNDGRVRNKGVAVKIRGKYQIVHENDILKPFHSRKYSVVKLCNNKFEKTVFVHRLVAQEFIPNVGNKPEVNHINGDTSDNCVSNLEWCTRDENLEHARKNHLFVSRKFGEHPRARPIAKYDLSGNLIRTYTSISEALTETKCDSTHISDSCSGRRITAGGYIYRYIPENEAVETKITVDNKLTISSINQLERNGNLTHSVAQKLREKISKKI